MYHLAVDIGVSSGRHIVGWREGGELKTREVYRFPNGVAERVGHLTWDMEGLLREVKAGVKAAFAFLKSVRKKHLLAYPHKKAEPCQIAA